MANPTDPVPQPPPPRPAAPAAPAGGTCSANGDSMPCDRCGTEMFRMHAVWRCPTCGYKTDCCGW